MILENTISYEIRGAIFDVYNELGPGLFESVYAAALTHELEARGLNVRREVKIPALYKDIDLEIGFRADLIVEDQVLVELKSVEKLDKVHHKQVLTYLKLSGLRLGILVNFNVEDITKGVHRKVNGLGESYNF